jgi:hypothetical protein
MAAGIFNRGNRTNVRPIDLGRHLVREIDDKRSVDSKSRRVAPNYFVFRLHPRDLDQLEEFQAALEVELSEAAKEYARSEGYHLKGPITVSLVADDKVKSGRVEIDSKVRRAESPIATGTLVVSGGQSYPLGEKQVVIGRSPDCTIVLDDANVSRRHAEVKVVNGAYAVSDLGSTNGTKVNGVAVGADRALRDGDIITLGSHSIRFEAASR